MVNYSMSSVMQENKGVFLFGTHYITQKNGKSHTNSKLYFSCHAKRHVYLARL